MKSRERRSAEVRVTQDDGRTFEALAVAYNVVDDYGTRFVKGWASEGLAQRLPVIAWSHNWSEPIGRVTAYREADEGLYITGRFSDPEAVPRARQAAAQLRDGDLTDVSVGFTRLADRTGSDGVVDITKGELDEVSIVLRGAVPGSRVLSLRSAEGAVTTVAEDAVVSLARRVTAGELTQEEAKVALALLADPVDPEEHGGEVIVEDDPTPDPDAAEWSERTEEA